LNSVDREVIAHRLRLSQPYVRTIIQQKNHQEPWTDLLL